MQVLLAALPSVGPDGKDAVTWPERDASTTVSALLGKHLGDPFWPGGSQQGSGLC